MLKDIGLYALTAAMAFLIVLKNDKQMVHLLEGKLFQRGMNTSAAKIAFSRHTKTASVFLFVCGFWLVVVGLVMSGTGAAGIAVAFVGALCALLGVLGRIRSFMAAEKELG